MSKRRLAALFLFLVVTIISAVAGIVIKFTLSGISTLPFLTYRFAISSVVAIPFLLFYKKSFTGLRPFSKNVSTILELFIFSFITSTLALGLLFLGLEKTTVLDMTLITSIGPLVIGAAGAMYLREHITSREKVGMVIAFLGTVLVLVEPIIRLHDGKHQVLGNVILILYVFSTAVSAVLGKRLLQKRVSPITMTNSIFIVGFLTIIPVALYTYGLPNLVQTVTTLSMPYQLGVLFMALVSGNLAYTLGNKAQKSIEISEASLFTYLIPIFTAPLAIVFLGEKLTPVLIVSSVIVLAGVVIAEYKKKRYN
ncbi:MAG TPA: DMT family transporter [Patescibacteria group bacterium]